MLLSDVDVFPYVYSIINSYNHSSKCINSLENVNKNIDNIICDNYEYFSDYIELVKLLVNIKMKSPSKAIIKDIDASFSKRNDIMKEIHQISYYCYNKQFQFYYDKINELLNKILRRI